MAASPSLLLSMPTWRNTPAVTPRGPSGSLGGSKSSAMSALEDLTDDLIANALDDLAAQRGRYWAGIDADGKAIFKAKAEEAFLARASIAMRHALAAVLTWSFKKRVAPPVPCYGHPLDHAIPCCCYLVADESLFVVRRVLARSS